MGHRKRRDQGPQHHAEGQHGSKTHRAFIRSLQKEPTTKASDAFSSREIEGHHRLKQDRQQHDEGEKTSEQTEELRQRLKRL